MIYDCSKKVEENSSFIEKQAVLSFAEKLKQGKKVIAVELDPPFDANIEKVAEQVNSFIARRKELEPQLEEIRAELKENDIGQVIIPARASRKLKKYLDSKIPSI